MAAQVPTPELVAEIGEVAEALGQDLVQAQKEAQGQGVNPARINAMFRSGHTLKGLFGMLGHKAGQQLAHSTEDVLEGMRMGRIAVSREALGALFACVDQFQVHVGQQPTPAEQQDIEALLGRLRALTGSTSAGGMAPQHNPGPSASAAPSPPADDTVGLSPELRRMLTEYEEYRFDENKRLGLHLMAAQVVLSLLDCDVALPALETQLAAQGEIIARLPSLQMGVDATIAFDILLAAKASAVQVAERLGRPDVTLRALNPMPQAESGTGAVSGGPPGVELAQTGADEGALGAPSPWVLPTEQVTAGAIADGPAALQTVRVDIRRLDQLMHLVAELGATRNVLGRLAQKLKDHPQPAALAAELDQEGTRLERRIGMLQAQVLEARMVPLGTLFDRLVRAGTKVALELGVEVQFELLGGQTELDKRIVEELADPLLHLVRNAIDHGLGSAAARAQAGKIPKGTVRISAQAQGSHVVVAVADDGAGIDVQAVASAAVAKNVIGKERLAELSPDQRLRLILLPGFSTRQSVSAFSGRGVGLDVVKTHVERLGGGVEINTCLGEGTTFTLLAPVTLAILPALIVAVKGSQYAIPLAHVGETVDIEPAMVTSTQGRPTLRLRNSSLALTALIDLLQPPAPAQSQAPAMPYAIIVGLASKQTAVGVCDIVGQQNIVIKPLGPRLAHVRGLAGAAQVDDRGLILVLDVVGLINEARESAARPQDAS